MNTMEKIKASIVPSLFTGAAATLLYYGLVDRDLTSSIPFGPIDLPVFAAVGGAAAIGDLAGEVTTEFVLPHFQKNQFLLGMEDKIVPPVLSGLGTYAVMSTLISGGTSFMYSFGIGAGGAVAGKYVYGMI